MISERFEQEVRDMDGTKIRVISYKIGENFFCHISNFDPDATIARSHAGTREAAVNDAVQKAHDRIVRYRR